MVGPLHGLAATLQGRRLQAAKQTATSGIRADDPSVAAGEDTHEYWRGDSLQWGNYKQQTNSVVWVRERTITNERPPTVGKFSANFCG
jgi:hypothetical protein